MYIDGKYCGPSEEVTQQHIMQWAGNVTGKYPELELLFHVPNGGFRHKATAGKLKAQGAKAGVPDLCLPVARGGYFGLYIELKVGKNKASKVQDWWLEELRGQGYYTTEKNGFDETINCLTWYLKLPRTQRMVVNE